MCWSAQVSFTTFFLGTAFNVAFASYFFYSNNKVPALLIIGWQYGLLMQLAEGSAWINIDAGRPHESSSRAAMVLNITQPHAMFLVVSAGRWPVKRPAYGMVALLVYSFFLLSMSGELYAESDSIAPKQGCDTLYLKWWDAPEIVMYLCTSVIILCEIQSLFWRVVNLGIFCGSLLVALHVYPCGVGSLWCWIIALASPTLFLLHFIRKRFPNRDSCFDAFTVA